MIVLNSKAEIKQDECAIIIPSHYIIGMQIIMVYTIFRYQFLLFLLVDQITATIRRIRRQIISLRIHKKLIEIGMTESHRANNFRRKLPEFRHIDETLGGDIFRKSHSVNIIHLHNSFVRNQPRLIYTRNVWMASITYFQKDAAFLEKCPVCVIILIRYQVVGDLDRPHISKIMVTNLIHRGK